MDSLPKRIIFIPSKVFIARMKINFWNNANAIDKITLIYLWCTAPLCIFVWSDLEIKVLPLAFRVVSSAIIYVMIRFPVTFNKGIPGFLRIAYPLLLVIYLYPETDLFNNIIFENQDRIFYNIEESIFGFQPAIRFLERFPQLWMNELMSFGYFSYYLIIFSFSLVLYLKVPHLYYNMTFIIVASFYLYYAVFIILPVAGPQYYLLPPDNEVPKAYVFSSMLKLVQELGERPTGAFPSSHIGINVIILWYSFIYTRKYFYWIIPVSVILFLSTVYIKAHYIVDIIGALLTLPLFVLTARYFYSLLEKE